MAHGPTPRVPRAGPPELTIQSPTTEATWTTWSTNVDLSGLVSADLNVKRVSVMGSWGGTRIADGTNVWRADGLRLYPGRTNVIWARASAPSWPAVLGSEIRVSDTIRIVQKRLVMEATVAGGQLALRWTPGADRYVIERCADLAVPGWTPILTTAATEVSLPRTERQEFYRVKLGP